MADAAIEVATSETELFIRFNGLTHLRLSRADYVGLQSWSQNLGRDTPKYEIEFYMRGGSMIKSEYNNRERWEEILRKLDAVPILKEWE